MDALQNLKNSPYFYQGAFLVGMLLILGAWKFGIEGILE